MNSSEILYAELPCRDEHERTKTVRAFELLDDRDAKLSVLPEPVSDCARTSFPATIAGMISFCIGVATVMPCFSRREIIGLLRLMRGFQMDYIPLTEK